VEDVLMAFSGIEQAAVFSMPNEFGNDVLWAALVARSEIDPQTLRAHCAAKLPPEFVPVAVVKVPDLPRNPGGKVERSRLAELAKASQPSSPAVRT
jgi:acyl-CoA synthetase (AMP-forming)/AMP-acid ligase II